MFDCIFTGHCSESYKCSLACPILAETSYLLERNEISMASPVFRLPKSEIKRYQTLLEASSTDGGSISSVIVGGGDFTNLTADAITYCAICENWKGSQLHCTVYNLKFSQYLEALQSSWSFGSDSIDRIDQMKIWISNARVLIISNLDFINFKDFQSQALLSLLQARAQAYQKTIIVSPPVSSLVGDGQFFAKLTSLISSKKVGENT